jgi:tetratricopeptide (TPR) repeat protein
MARKSNVTVVNRLKAVKSAYILEADALMDRGMEAAAMELFIKAAEMELELADFYHSRSEEGDAQISRFSAASCFFRARQYQRATALFEQVRIEFPEARKLVAKCKGRQDVALTGATPGLQALIDLLVKKKVFDEAEWAEAVAAR